MNYKKNIIAVSLIVFLISCHSRQEPVASVTAAVKEPVAIDEVIGMGKVEPQDGIADLAAETSGIVRQVNKAAGDKVRKGEVLLILSRDEESLNIAKIEAQIRTQKGQLTANQQQGEQYQIQIGSKMNTLQVSRNLLQTGAETKDNVNALQTDISLLQSQLLQSEKAADVDKLRIKELENQLALARHQLNEKTIKAPADGTLLTMDAHVGSALMSLESFASFAPDGPLIVSAEADEMFADKLKTGQAVRIYSTDQHKFLAQGKIYSILPNFSDKSLFTDEPGELQDRRVRRFKVALDNDSPLNLLINTKVEYRVQLN